MASTVRALIDGWIPAGDQANIATRALDVFTSRTALVGLHSDAGALTHHAVYGLGPMLFWLLALPTRIGGPWALALTMGLVNIAAIVGVVALVRRRGGQALMFVTAIAVVVMSRSLAPEVLHDVWNPSAALFPFTLLILLCWSLACGEHRLLPVTVLVASFVVQCQLAFLAPSLGLMAVGLAGLLVSHRSTGPGVSERATSVRVVAEPGSVRRRSLGRWVLAALLVAVACWIAPAIDQIEGKPGNLSAIARAATANHSSLGAGVGWHAIALAVGIRPWWTTDPASPYERKSEVRTAPGALATVSTLLALSALLLVGAIGVHRRRVELWTGALIALVLCAALGVVAAATPTLPALAATLGYTMWWGSPAGMFVWVILAWIPAAMLAARPLVHRIAPAFLAAGGIGAATLAGAVVAAAERTDEHLQEYRPLGAMFASLNRSVPGGRTVLLIGSLGNATFRFKMAARFALVRRGIHPVSPGTDARLGSWYELDHHRYDCTVYVQDGHAAPRRGAVALLGFTYGRRYPVSVWISPRGCPRLGQRGPAPPSHR
ncbi:MAG: hypothetical protein M3Z95_02485 [Actinomycetota bacterium]|nr:hypothetical protein [Actinomycetota bacterium]